MTAAIEAIIARIQSGESSRALDALIEEYIQPGQRYGSDDGRVEAGQFGVSYEAPNWTTGSTELKASAVQALRETAIPSDEEVARLRPRQDFLAEHASGPLDWFPLDYIISGREANHVVDETPLRDGDWAKLFAYMHRRFGPPTVPGDAYKDLTGGWVLTTPMTDIFVVVKPGVDEAYPNLINFRAYKKYVKGSSIYTLTPVESWRAIRSAVKDTILDLLRPVNVRDLSINALGRCDSDWHYQNELEAQMAADLTAFGVGYHHSSGFVWPAGIFASDDWFKLKELMYALGEADGPSVGLQSILRTVETSNWFLVNEAPTSDKIALATAMKLQFFGQEMPKDFMNLRLSIVATMSADAHVENLMKDDKTNLQLLEQLEDSAKQVSRLARLVGWGSVLKFDFERRIKSQIIKIHSRLAKEDLDAILSQASDPNIPEFPAVMAARNDYNPEVLINGWRDLGRDDLANWGEQTINRPGGRTVVGLMITNLVIAHMNREKTENTPSITTPTPSVRP